MRVAIGGDQAGFSLQEPLIHALKAAGHEVVRCGPTTPEPVDFPDVARLVCETITAGMADRAIMVCGTGVGASMAANKIPGIRAALCHDLYSAHQCVEHDDANVLCLGAQIIGELMAVELVDTFLAAKFSTEEHFRRRVRKLNLMDRGKVEEAASKGN